MYAAATILVFLKINRLAGWKAGLVVFLADVGKGAIASGVGLALALLHEPRLLLRALQSGRRREPQRVSDGDD